MGERNEIHLLGSSNFSTKDLSLCSCVRKQFAVTSDRHGTVRRQRRQDGCLPSFAAGMPERLKAIITRGWRCVTSRASGSTANYFQFIQINSNLSRRIVICIADGSSVGHLNIVRSEPSIRIKEAL